MTGWVTDGDHQRDDAVGVRQAFSPEQVALAREAIDAVDRSATLEFIAGTHRGPWFMPRTFMDDQATWFPEGAPAEMPDFSADPDNWPVIGWPDAHLPSGVDMDHPLFTVLWTRPDGLIGSS